MACKQALHVQAMLIFTEAILVAQYTYQIPTRLHCGAITPRVQAGFEKAGLHGNAFRCIPIFCAYLSILMHTYSLVRQQVQLLLLLSSWNCLSQVCSGRAFLGFGTSSVQKHPYANLQRGLHLLLADLRNFKGPHHVLTEDPVMAL